jgi:hypothetical protein
MCHLNIFRFKPYQLNPAEDLGNLPAHLTQSEITANVFDPELLGDLFNSANPPLTGREGWITAVVAKASCIAPENLARKNLKHSTGHRTSDTVIRILLDSGSDGDLTQITTETLRNPPTSPVRHWWILSAISKVCLSNIPTNQSNFLKFSRIWILDGLRILTSQNSS